MPTLRERLHAVRALGGHFRLFFGDVDSGIRASEISIGDVIGALNTVAEVEKLCKGALDASHDMKMERDLANERAGVLEADLAAERTRSANGLKAIEAAQAGIAALTAELKEAKHATGLKHATLVCTQGALTQAEQKLAAAEARIKVLEGSAKPVLWGRFFDDGAINTYLSEADARGFGNGGVVEPLYRHPPKTGEPVASVGYVVQRRAQGGAWWNYNTLYSDLDGVDRFIKSSLGYWDRDEGRILEVVAVRSRMAIAGGKPNAFVDGKWTPLYEAPPPAAIGVETEEFAVRAVGEKNVCAFQWMNDHEVRDVGTRAETTQLARSMGPGATVVRIVPADAPVVDLAVIRDALPVLADMGLGPLGSKALDAIRAAIGEKA